MSGAADVILYNGAVITLDSASPRAGALAVKADRFLAVGDDRAVLQHASPSTKVIDLHGRTVTPGFFDAHAHMDREGLKRWAGVSLEGRSSVAEIVAVIAEAARAKAPGEWIVTSAMGTPPHNYVHSPEQLKEGRFPGRLDLDAVAPDNPVFIRSPWGWWSRPPFPSVANTAALELAGITSDTSAPHNVEIVKDACGEPTGLFLERNYTPILEYTLFRRAPRFTEVDRIASVELGARALTAAGTTAIYEGHGITPALLTAYLEAEATGRLPLRVSLPLSVPTAAFDNSRIGEMLHHWARKLSGRGQGTDRLRMEGICLDVGDPAIANIIACHYPYEHLAGHYYQSLSRERLVEIGEIAAQLGIRVNCLVCYDLERVLSAFEEVNRRISIRDKRWVLVHVTQASDDQIRRMREIGVMTTVTPNFMYMAKDRFGLANLREQGIPIRRLLDAGVPVALSSDGVPYSMLWTMWEAIARWDADSGQQLGPSDLGREEALKLACQTGHALTWNEDRLGSITRGKIADFVVLDQNPLTCDEDAIKDIEVVATYVGGTAVTP